MEIRPLILALSLLTVPFVGTESKPVPIFYGTVAEPARTQLMRAWTDSAYQVEKAYCVTAYNREVIADPLHRQDSVVLTTVTAVEPAKVTGATASGIESVECGGKPTVHTHPPITCALVEEAQGEALQRLCYYGGPNAFSCQASRTDYESLTNAEYFGIVQCDRKSFVFYYRHHYTLDKPGWL